MRSLVSAARQTNTALQRTWHVSPVSLTRRARVLLDSSHRHAMLPVSATRLGASVVALQELCAGKRISARAVLYAKRVPTKLEISSLVIAKSATLSASHALQGNFKENQIRQTALCVLLDYSQTSLVLPLAKAARQASSYQQLVHLKKQHVWLVVGDGLATKWGLPTQVIVSIVKLVL